MLHGILRMHAEKISPKARYKSKSIITFFKNFDALNLISGQVECSINYDDPRPCWFLCFCHNILRKENHSPSMYTFFSATCRFGVKMFTVFLIPNCSSAHVNCFFDKPAQKFLPKVWKNFAQNPKKKWFFHEKCFSSKRSSRHLRAVSIRMSKILLHKVRSKTKGMVFCLKKIIAQNVLLES